MKIRNGFVSNSSSSSFLVAFDKLPEDVYALHKLLFEGRHYIEPPDKWGDPESVAINSFDAALDIWKEIQKQIEIGIPLTTKDLMYRLYYDFEEKDLEQLIKKYKGKHLFHFNYEDDTAWGRTMEKGDVFQNVPHEKISHH